MGGAAIGAVIALLTAPDSGANTRHKIAGKIKQGGQKVKDTLEEGYHSMQHSMQE
ncbi:YtxH domain-containing protein [Alistipes ihumii]|uniref:YtxH domain-containing protein n=1 Tax=Alistipes ihumii TaxID=1470347 RepID=UPI003AB54F8B